MTDKSVIDPSAMNSMLDDLEALAVRETSLRGAISVEVDADSQPNPSVSVLVRNPPADEVAIWVSAHLFWSGATSVTVSRSMVVAAFPRGDANLVAGVLRGELMQLFERAACESCDGSGCGDCYNGKAYVWRDTPMSAFAVSVACAAHIIGKGAE